MSESHKKVTVDVWIPNSKNTINEPDMFVQAKINNFGFYEEALKTAETKISPSDIDGTINITRKQNGKFTTEHFLVIEAKYLNSTAKDRQQGQLILLKALSKQPNTNVMMLYFERDDLKQNNPRYMQMIKNGVEQEIKPTSAKHQGQLMLNWLKRLGR